jgi:ribonuclease H / adenosylcobalamin/alpha-ribazole phosphatase
MVNLTDKLRKKITNKLVYNLKKQEEIISLTFVGSFIDKNNSKDVNDIDLILITKKLDKKNYTKYINLIKKIDPKKFNLKKNRLIINPTFGPLKFNHKPDHLVIHLMVYDIEGHIDHCTKSPFTVYDWERSNFFYKKRMKTIFPIGTIQLRDFIEARRGIENYLYDLANKQISYREYKLYIKGYKTITKNMKLVERDKFEFYFHIIKNLTLNYIKFINQKNKLIVIKKNDQKINFFLGKSFYERNIDTINYLINKKKDFNFNLDKKFDSSVLKFVKDYSDKLKKLSTISKKIIFFRHAKTNFNDGSFLGQNRDPRIIPYKKKNIKKETFSKIYTSPLIRCKESVKILSSKNNYITDKNLLEINYGRAEGIDIKDLNIFFPNIIKKWNEKKDPKFPGGESYKDVGTRLNKFLKKIIKKKIINCCVITHNIFLRVLVGQTFNIPKEKWHNLYIPHLMRLEFIILNNKIYPNIERENLKIIFSKLK